MNEIVQDVIINVIANGLTAVLSQISQKTRDLVNRHNQVHDFISKDQSVGTILRKASAIVADAIPHQNNTFVDDLRDVLSSPEIDSIVRQIFSSQLIHEANGHLDSIRRVFIEVLSLRLGKSIHELTHLGSQLFATLYDSCDKALSLAIENGLLAAHEAKSAVRHRMVLNELAAVKKSLALLEQSRKPNLEAFVEFENKYREQVKNRHAHITPPNFDSARKLRIDDIYVSPDFTPVSKRKDRTPDRLKLQDFLNNLYRAVLLGNPGGGKSTFANKISHDLAERYTERLIAGRQLSPILVVLRDYGAEKKIHSCSILQFIESTANSHYQITPPKGAFEYLLRNGRLIVIFDGLDELLDTAYRQEISSDVEAFCNLYPSVPVLVTSREVGYEQAPLDEKGFDVFRLSPFDEEQVEEYANKWFSTDLEFTAEQRQQKALDFLHESRIAPDLRSNPLMLGLMCNIYRGESYIPRNRPDVYEKCALMLFERWDKMRGIHASLPFEAHIRPTMMFLAHWIYSDDTLQGGVTERRLITKATEYLCPKRFEDQDEAERAATEFIEFCRGRAWVFTDTGTTREGESLYQFTHRTFLEYFTAAHLFRTNPTAEGLASLLLPRISKREWDVVTQLAFQIQNKNVEGAADFLLGKLLRESSEARPNKASNLLSFATRSLEFLVPSPKTTREVSAAASLYCFNWTLSRLKRIRGAMRASKRRAEAQEIIGSLLCAATENRALISDSLEKFFRARLTSDKTEECLAAIDMVAPLSFAIHFGNNQRAVDPATMQFWEDFARTLFLTHWDVIKRQCATSRKAAFNGLILGRLTIRDFINSHGVAALFSPMEYEFTQIVLPCPADLLLFMLDASPNPPWWLAGFPNSLEMIADTGEVLVNATRPWIKWEHAPNYGDIRFWYFSMRSPELAEKRPLNSTELTDNELFGVFCLFAPMLEANENEKNIVDWLRADFRIAAEQIRGIFLARIEGHKTGQIPLGLELGKFSKEQAELIQQWVRGKINFVQRTSTSPSGSSGSA
jgi:hypothetical protein